MIAEAIRKATYCAASTVIGTQKTAKIIGEITAGREYFPPLFIDLDYGLRRNLALSAGGESGKTRSDAALREVILSSHRSAERFLRDWMGDLPGLASLGRTRSAEFSLTT
jgi:hypothetical protein